jgi:acetyl esterase
VAGRIRIASQSVGRIGSAGGTLAAVVALRARDEDGPRIQLQVMVYPVLDHDYETTSYRQFGSKWGVLTRTDMVWFHSHYVSHPDQLDQPYVHPLRCTDLSGLPKALIILPEVDPLRDEGLRYVEALRKAGVAAEARVYPGMVHGFWLLGGVLPQTLTAIEDAASFLRSSLTSQPASRNAASGLSMSA